MLFSRQHVFKHSFHFEKRINVYDVKKYKKNTPTLYSTYFPVQSLKRLCLFREGIKNSRFDVIRGFSFNTHYIIGRSWGLGKFAFNKYLNLFFSENIKGGIHTWEFSNIFFFCCSTSHHLRNIWKTLCRLAHIFQNTLSRLCLC